MHREPPRPWREPPPPAYLARAAPRSPLSPARYLRHTGCVASCDESIGSREPRAVRWNHSRAVGGLLRLARDAAGARSWHFLYEPQSGLAARVQADVQERGLGLPKTRDG